ncbi:MAG: hypothetical protein KIT84_17795 [Labilithrix sp.]|nr:hypothetical protein [Labilithrix sp.]MCW5812887.1 hypothetical protein [Labilithrix sp.]
MIRAVVFSVLLAACASREDTGGSVAVAVVHDGVCPFPACSCPASCLPIHGWVRDDAAGCTHAKVVLGCLDVTSLTSDGPCHRRVEDALLVTAPGSAIAKVKRLRSEQGLSEGWEACTLEESERVGPPECEGAVTEGRWCTSSSTN